MDRLTLHLEPSDINKYSLALGVECSCHDFLLQVVLPMRYELLYDFLLQSYISKTPYDTVRFLDELCYREDAKYDCGYVPVNPTISYDFTVKFV